jgi:hypothetical protein
MATNPEGFFKRVPLSVRKETRAIREDTGTEMNYAELTWSNRQILCDSLQNNLDAETRKFVAELEHRHIPSAEEYIQRADADPRWRESYLNILHLLQTLAVRAGDLEQVEKDRLIQKICDMADELGISIQGVDADHFQTSERPELPVLTYAVKDIETGKIIRNLSQDDLLQGVYANIEQFPLFEFKVEDSGSGYDVTKSVLYLPTKKGERFSRGMFGEGLKVNQAAIARIPGVNLRNHSQFETEDGSSVAWVRHVYPEENIVMQRGLHIDQKVGDSTGSGTTIRFVDYQDQNKELLETLDPRTTKVGEIAVEFAEHDFSYSLGITEDGFVQPGIALDGKPSVQYLQGLQVGTSADSLLFSYDFQNRDIIAGRDRNHLQPRVMRETVKGFWREVRSPSLYREFLQRVILSDSGMHAPEREAFFDACKRLYDGQGTDQDDILLRELVTVLDLRPDLPNYIATRADGRVERVDLTKANIVLLKISCDKDEASLLREVLKKHCSDFIFIEPQEIIPERNAPNESAYTSEKEFTEKEQKFSEDLNRMFKEVSNELVPLCTAFRESRGTTAIISPIIEYKRSRYADKVGFYVESTEGVRHITCYIPSNEKDDEAVPDLNDSSIHREFEAKLFELHLAAIMLGKGSFYSESSEYREYAQMSAQELLDHLSSRSVLGSGVHDSLQPLYRQALVLQREQFRGKERKKTLDALVAEFQLYEREASELQCSPERILEIMNWCKGHSEIRGTSNLRTYLEGRVIVENLMATYVEYTDTGAELKKVKLSEDKKSGVWNGYSEYKLDNGYYVIPVETQDHAIFKILNDRMIAICDGVSVYIDTNACEVKSGTSIRSNQFRMDKGCIISSDSLSDWEGNPSTFHTVAQERDPNEASVETGTVKSPVTLEYISDHWSDPIRIFQDLGQNHMDAGGLEERFLVMEGGEKVWVSSSKLGHSKILGYELSDRGLGYSPSGIHTMGHTQKRNPFLTGKNGEGLKLASASAKKQGFDISFASFGFDNDGVEVVWQAKADTVDEKYIHDRKTNTAHRLVFDVKKEDRSILEDRSAFTQVVLPDDADEACFYRWSTWMDCVDPRNKDELGNGGMRRYLLVNEDSRGESDTVGPTTVLLERPGEIFENGTLIRTEKQTDRRYTLGWNFPSITSTRERTHINEDMARAYIQYYFKNTTDEKVVERVLRSIKLNHISEYDLQFAREERLSTIADMAQQKHEKLDVNPNWALPDSGSYPSLALFQEKAKKLYPGKILFSYEVARRKRISMEGSIQHIRPERRLNVSEDDYLVLRHIFPTMEDYMRDVQSSIIDIEAETLEPLRAVVGDEISRVEAAIDILEQDPKTASVLEYVLKVSNTTREQVTERLSKLLPENATGTAADVFLMADDSNADGLASTGIGLKVSLLEGVFGKRAGRMYGVIDHELAHKMLDTEDYTTEFILLLGLMAMDRLRPHGLYSQTPPPKAVA